MKRETKEINWEEDFNEWLWKSDELFEGIMINGTPGEAQLVLSLDEGIFKISYPGCWNVETKSSDQTVQEIAKTTHGQCVSSHCESLAEVLTTLVKIYREITQMDLGKDSGFAEEELEAQSKPYIAYSFKESSLYKVGMEAISYLKNSPMKYAAKIQIIEDLGMVKLEFNFNCLDISPTSIDSLGLTYESFLFVNLIYSPDFLAVTNEPNMSISELLSRGYIKTDTNQNGSLVTFASNYLLDLVIQYNKILIKYNKLIQENTPNQFLNGCFMEIATEMGAGEQKVAEMLCVAGNDIFSALELLHLNTHEYIEYYIEDLSKNDFMFQNYVINLITYIKKRMERCTEYCISCGKKLYDESIRLSPCNSELCMFKYEEIFGVKLYPELQNNMPLLELDFSLTDKALFSSRVYDIFEPFPSFFLKHKEIRERTVFAANAIVEVSKENKNIEKMKKIFRQFPSLSELKMNCISDQDIKDIFGKYYSTKEDQILAYKFFTYLVATNRLRLEKLKDEDRIKSFPPEVIQFIITNQNPEFERKFDINKKKFGSHFVFHGSGCENWYSILRNGIRVCSNSRYMTAGAACGAGVYGSNQFSTSYGYSVRSSYGVGGIPAESPQFFQDKYPNFLIMGIMEVIIEGKNPCLGVVCIPKNEYVALRYVLLFPSTYPISTAIDSTSLGLDKHYSNYLGKIKAEMKNLSQHRIAEEMKRIKKEEEEKEKAKLEYKRIEDRKSEEEEKYQNLEKLFIGKGSPAAAKRLFMEYRALNSSKEFQNVHLSFREDNIYVWKMSFDILKFELSKELKADFEFLRSNYSVENPTLEFEVIFSDNFPFDPPFIRVVRPRFAFHTGHITIGGSICMEVLTPSGWTVAISIENLFIDILTTICMGGGRLDLKNWNKEYTIHEAHEAFKRVARDHGWLKGQQSNLTRTNILTLFG